VQAEASGPAAGTAGLLSVLCWLPKDDLRRLLGALDPVGLGPFAVVLTGLLVVLTDLAALRWPGRPAWTARPTPAPGLLPDLAPPVW